MRIHNHGESDVYIGQGEDDFTGYRLAPGSYVDLDVGPLTKMVLSEPHKPPPVATGFAGDDIEDLGERIAALEPEQAAELWRYLKGKGTDEPT